MLCMTYLPFLFSLSDGDVSFCADHHLLSAWSRLCTDWKLCKRGGGVSGLDRLTTGLVDLRAQQGEALRRRCASLWPFLPVDLVMQAQVDPHSPFTLPQAPYAQDDAGKPIQVPATRLCMDVCLCFVFMLLVLLFESTREELNPPPPPPPPPPTG